MDDQGGPTPAQYQERDGAFGCRSRAGKVWQLGGTFDDLLVCAPRDGDLPTSTQMVGHVYGYQGHPTNPLSMHPIRLDPGVIQDDEQVGNLGVSVGKMKSGDPYNVVASGAYLRDVDAIGAQGLTLNVGAVDFHQIQGSSSPRQSVFGANHQGIIPPPLPGVTATAANQVFGLAVELADLDDDGFTDLIVSATGATDASGAGGLVYVFWGGPGPAFGIDPSQPRVTILAGSVTQFLPTGFGAWIETGDVDGDGKADLLVGEPKWDTATLADVGRVHLFSGAQIALSKPAGTWQSPPNHPAAWSTAAPVATFTEPVLQAGSNFGWYCWLFDADGDGKLDVVGHAEATDWPGHPTGVGGPANTVRAAGSSCIFRGTSTGSGVFTFEPARWIFSDAPGQDYRFGKHMDAIDWVNTSTQQPARAVVAGEPDTNQGGNGHAGRVVLFFWSQIALVCFDTPTSLVPSWSASSGSFLDFAALGPAYAGPQRNELWGRWITPGVFNEPVLQEQLAVCASGRHVPRNPYAASSSPELNAGAAAHLKQGN